MKVIEESDGDEYVTESEDVEGIEWYSTDHPGETIVDQLYRQNAELKKEIEDRILISRRSELLGLKPVKKETPCRKS